MTEPAQSMFAPEVLADPFAYYQRQLKQAPVFQDPGTGIWVVVSHDLVSQATGMVEALSNDIGAVLAGGNTEDPDVQAEMAKGWPQMDTLLTADPPVHTRFRKLVNLAFSMPKVNKLEGQIRNLVNQLLDTSVATGRCEFIHDFAIPLPVSVIAQQLGMEALGVAKIKQWTDAFVDRIGRMGGKEREVECARLAVEFQHAVKSRIDERRANPTEDLLSDLVHARVEGEQELTDAEIMSVVQQLMVAGNETTTATLAEGMILLANNPAQFEQVKADLSLVPNMVEEFMRLATPSTGMWRVAKQDVELGGVTIPAGSMVMLRYAAANRDPAKYENPDHFDPARSNARTHLSFGKGIHMCIGNMLSRKELTVAFQEILPRIKAIHITDRSAVVYPPNMVLRGVTALPLVFEMDV
jgi:cytochrome P450